MDEIMDRCTIAFDGCIKSNYARFAFAKLAYMSGRTYYEICTYLKLGNHSSAIYYVRRAEELVERGDERFLGGWIKVRQKDEKMEQALNLLTSNILNYLMQESDPKKRFNYIRFVLIGVQGSGTKFQQRCNVVG